MITWQAILSSGWGALIDYVWHHTLTCLVPAFFIAGAIASFISKDSVMKYFGLDANKFLSYSIASVSGAILAVCSCTVLPIFAGINRRGAGLGPAIAFLYSGPAINILAIIYTARLLGPGLGLARAILAVLFAVAIGLMMAIIYRKEENQKNKEMPMFNAMDNEKGNDLGRLVFIATLVLILLTATSKFANFIKWPFVIAEIFFVVYMSLYWFERSEINMWLSETWNLMKLIVPVLLIGVFFAGVIEVLLPPAWVGRFVGGNTFLGNFIASISGAFMYFATLTEVPIIKTLLNLGMGRGPALTLLLAGPALSLPSMLAIQRIIGTKKMLTFVSLVVVFSTVAGLLFGVIMG